MCVSRSATSEECADLKKEAEHYLEVEYPDDEDAHDLLPEALDETANAAGYSKLIVAVFDFDQGLVFEEIRMNTRNRQVIRVVHRVTPEEGDTQGFYPVEYSEEQ
jgi:hypothetical protein